MFSFFHPRSIPRNKAGEAAEWILCLCYLWFIGGLYLDGWAHNHLADELETFFTPWHAVFYSGYVAVAVALFILTWMNKEQEKSWAEAVPLGHGYSVVGALLFAIGGSADMLWHQIFGIEADIDALLSPPHLILAVGFVMIISGNLRSWWLRADEKNMQSLRAQLPMLISVGCVLGLITFMTQFAHFISHPGMEGIPQDRSLIDLTQSRAIAGFLFQVTVLMGITFMLMRRGRLAPGSVTFFLVLNVLGMGYMRDGLSFVPAALVAGILADVMLQSLYPLKDHQREIRFFAFAMPAFFFLTYFLTIALNSGIWWSLHLWLGSIVIVGLAGLLLSFVAFPIDDRME